MAIDAPSMTEIFTEAETIINAAISASSGALNRIKKIHIGGGFPPMATFPLITLGADRMRREHKRATGDTALDKSFGVQYDWFIAIVDSTGDLQTSFENVDAIFHELLETIDINYRWNNIVDDTNYGGDIEFGSPQFGDTSQLTYVILVPLVSNYRWGRS